MFYLILFGPFVYAIGIAFLFGMAAEDLDKKKISEKWFEYPFIFIWPTWIIPVFIAFSVRISYGLGKRFSREIRK